MKYLFVVSWWLKTLYILKKNIEIRAYTRINIRSAYTRAGLKREVKRAIAKGPLRKKDPKTILKTNFF